MILINSSTSFGIQILTWKTAERTKIYCIGDDIAYKMSSKNVNLDASEWRLQIERSPLSRGSKKNKETIPNEQLDHDHDHHRLEVFSIRNRIILDIRGLHRFNTKKSCATIKPPPQVVRNIARLQLQLATIRNTSGCITDQFWLHYGLLLALFRTIYGSILDYSGCTLNYCTLAVFRNTFGCIYYRLHLAVFKTTSGCIPDYFQTTTSNFQTMTWLYTGLL